MLLGRASGEALASDSVLTGDPDPCRSGLPGCVLAVTVSSTTNARFARSRMVRGVLFWREPGGTEKQQASRQRLPIYMDGVFSEPFRLVSAPPLAHRCSESALPSALLDKRFSLGASWAFSIH
jgi:hypothetical protein